MKTTNGIKVTFGQESTKVIIKFFFFIKMIALICSDFVTSCQIKLQKLQFSNFFYKWQIRYSGINNSAKQDEEI